MLFRPARSLFLIFAAVLGQPVTLPATTTLASPFGDHAVLQRDRPIPIWGRATPGEKIVVRFHAESVETIADPDGRWSVKLPALPASRAPAVLRVQGGNVIEIRDVLVGEVWLCSGQSNMTFNVASSHTAQTTIPAANHPLIRQLSITQTTANSPAADVQAAWEVCSPGTVGRFTAVGYYFAQEIFESLQVPVGIIHCAWGATQIESWMSVGQLASQPGFAIVAQRWQQDLKQLPENQANYDVLLRPWLERDAIARKGEEKAYRTFLAANPRPFVPINIRPASAPSALYNGMIHPLIPYAFRGVLWYQGEANAVRADEYRALFTTMIQGWRTDFGQVSMPFYWVNLANYKGDAGGVSWARLREAQTATLDQPSTGQAIAIDIGESHEIHPTNKKDVGHRLALLALSRTYGTDVACVGPTFKEVRAEGGTMVVYFDHADGLHVKGPGVPTLEIAGVDQHFHPATAEIDGETLRVSSPHVAAPIAVRYAFRNAPIANLYNRAGLPAVPFRTDTW